MIVLDQFSRNIYRNLPQAFENDALALALVQEAIAVGADQALSQSQRNVLYLPFMHSESTVIHQRALALFEANGDSNTLEFERKHRAIIDRFGRYPHRNSILSRVSSQEELAFLQQPGSGF